jgi:hypothetical protein
MADVVAGVVLRQAAAPAWLLVAAAARSRSDRPDLDPVVLGRSLAREIRGGGLAGAVVMGCGGPSTPRRGGCVEVMD